MPKLIAVAPVSVAVDGVRTTFQPGEEVTGLHPLDEEDLKRCGAIQDQDELNADDKASAKASAAAGREFATAKKQELAKQAAAAAAQP
jgi:hypothetical protein